MKNRGLHAESANYMQRWIMFFDTTGRAWTKLRKKRGSPLASKFVSVSGRTDWPCILPAIHSQGPGLPVGSCRWRRRWPEPWCNRKKLLIFNFFILLRKGGGVSGLNCSNFPFHLTAGTQPKDFDTALDKAICGSGSGWIPCVLCHLPGSGFAYPADLNISR
jgi:hypothetical protein